jgi:hypothetical protein
MSLISQHEEGNNIDKHMGVGTTAYVRILDKCGSGFLWKLMVIFGFMHTLSRGKSAMFGNKVQFIN